MVDIIENRVEEKLWRTNWNVGGIEDINEKKLHFKALFSSTQVKTLDSAIEIEKYWRILHRKGGPYE